MATSTQPSSVRPRLHITVPSWLNDPCAPAYDPKTGLYHLFWQVNPFSTVWGNMSWGHATSKDLLHWKFMPKQPALAPDCEYDGDGIFTGGMFPVTDDGTLRAVYSSVVKQPFHWHSPYPRNSVGLSVASSTDGGRNWIKSDNNPILEGEPEDVEVSGFRDPYIAPWKQFDDLRGTDEHWYGLISGGIRDKGPTSFVYAVKPDKPEEWKYIGPLIDVSLRWKSSEKWGGDLGVNWECVNFMTLGPKLEPQTTSTSTSTTTRDFIILGAEGPIERPDIKNHMLPDQLPPRTIRTQAWIQGDLEKSSSGDIRFKHRSSGLFDHGPYYAANSFVDPKTSRRIIHGWISDEDTTAKHAATKGWSGALALPREVYLQTIPNVVRALHTPLNEITNIEIESNSTSKGVTIHTIGQRPITELDTLRSSTTKTHHLPKFTLTPSTPSKHIANTTTPTWELTSTISLTQSCKRLGLQLRHLPDKSILTTLTLDVASEKITLDRSHSVSGPMTHEVNLCPDSGPFTLFTTIDASGIEKLEKLSIRILSDGDTMEVFVNERFAIGTVVYTGDYEVCGGITAFMEGDGKGSDEVAVFEEVCVWDGLNQDESLISGREVYDVKVDTGGSRL